FDCVFFCSSRRRHTRFSRDWSSDVCSSDLTLEVGAPIDMVVHLTGSKPRRQREFITSHTPGEEFSYSMKPVPFGALHSRRTHTRSEERRVGNERSLVWCAGRTKTKTHYQSA